MDATLSDVICYLVSNRQANFFARILTGMRIEQTRSIPAMAVLLRDRSYVLLYNDDWVKKATYDQVVVAIEHEAHHLILEHIPRQLRADAMFVGAEKQMLFRTVTPFAVDLADNSLLNDYSSSFQKVLKEMGLLYPGQAPFEKLPKQRSYEWYLSELMHEAKKDLDKLKQLAQMCLRAGLNQKGQSDEYKEGFKDGCKAREDEQKDSQDQKDGQGQDQKDGQGQGQDKQDQKDGQGQDEQDQGSQGQDEQDQKDQKDQKDGQGQGQDKQEQDQGQDEQDQGSQGQDEQDQGSQGQDEQDQKGSQGQGKQDQGQDEQDQKGGQGQPEEGRSPDYQEGFNAGYNASKEISEGADGLGRMAYEMLGNHQLWQNEADKMNVDDKLAIADELEHQGKSIVKKAVEDQNKNRGTVPGYLQEIIDSMLTEPRIPWTSILRNKVINTQRYKYRRSIRRPKRRNIGVPGLMKFPGRSKDRAFTVALIIDTSGSMGQDELLLAVSELQGLQMADKEIEIHVVQVDTQVQHEVKLGPHDEIDMGFYGRGGTDFNDGLIRAKELGPDICFFYTDGYAPAPNKKNRLACPFCWIITPGGVIPDKNYGFVIPTGEVSEENYYY